MENQSADAWRCSVCGYVHRGPGPPEVCPVCGAAASDFEPYQDQQPASVRAKIDRWRCLNCGYIHSGAEPPDECPVCAARKDRFEAIATEKSQAPAAGEAVRVVIVGAGIAGIAAVESIRSVSPEAHITLIAKEPDLPYYRLNLTRFLAGEIDEDSLPIHPESWYEEQGVEFVREAEVSRLLLEKRRIVLRNEEELEYERLILTVGAHPFVPPFPGTQRDGVMTLRTNRDALNILEAIQPGAKCVCIGGGILGIETAGALARRGSDVTMLEGHQWLMPRQLNAKGSELLQRHVEGLEVKVRTGAQTKELMGDERVAGVLLGDETQLPAELVIITTGIRPNSHLARRAGLEVNKGIVVDNHLRSSHPQVFAAGDVAEHRGVLFGTWNPSQYQGNIAGLNAVGFDAEFGGLPRSNTLKVLGLDLWSIGQFEPEDGSYQVVDEEKDGKYFRFVFHDSSLVGSILIGDTSASGPLKKAIEEKTDFSGVLSQRPSVGDLVDSITQKAGPG